MGWHFYRNPHGSSWIVEKNGERVFESPSEAVVVEYLVSVGAIFRGDAQHCPDFPAPGEPAAITTEPASLTIGTRGPRAWRPASPLSMVEISRIIELEKTNLSPAECLEKLGRGPPIIERLARVSELEGAGICELRRHGWSYRKIQELTARNSNTISKIIADDAQGARRSDKNWRCLVCGALNRLEPCETCRINRILNSQRLNARDARRHGLAWWRKINGREVRVRI